MEKQAVIEKLEQTYELATKARELREYAENGFASESKDKIIENTESLGIITGVPSVFKNMPEFIELESDEFADLSEKKANSKKVFMISLGITGIFCFLIFILKMNSLISLAAISVFITFLTGSNYSSKKGKYELEHKKYSENKTKFLESVDKYKTALKNYENEKEQGIKSAKEYLKKYEEAYEKQTKIINEMLKKQSVATDEHNEIIAQLKSIDIISAEYYHLIPDIIQILDTNRADTLKEALNIAIEQERAEKREAALIAEEQRRTQLMQEEQRRAQEEQRIYNQQLAAQAMMQTKMMKVEEERQRAVARNAERERREASYRESQAKSAAIQRCTRCANYNACGKARGQINCGAFRPKTY